VRVLVRIALGDIKVNFRSMKLFNWLNSFFSKNDKTKTKRPLTDEQFNELKSKREKKLNDILDKISKSGYDNLSTHEKNFLNNYKKTLD
jgi:hypothetical protein